MMVVDVADGVVTSARAEDFACSIDPQDPNRLPLTVGELFTHAAEVAAGGPGAELALGQQNFPSTIFVESRNGFYQFDLLELSIGESTVSAPSLASAQSDLDAALDQWTSLALTDYSIEFVASCQACDPEPIRVTVSNGAEPTAEESFPFVGVAGLFEVLQENLDRDPELFNVVYSNAIGVPAVGGIDESSDFDDDTFEFEVLSVIPVNQVNVLDVLGELGADLDNAPDQLLEAVGYRFCGLDINANDTNGPGDNPVGRRCLVDGAERQIPSVLVRQLSTVEGDPLPTVFTVDANGTVAGSSDSSADSFGSGGWSGRTCERGVTANSNWGLHGFDLAC